VRHTLAEVSHGILRMIVAAAEGHYNGVDAPPPVFLVQNLVAKSGANMHKRRVYDVLHFWEAIGLVRRAQGKGAYVWHGETGYKAFRHRLALQDPEVSWRVGPTPSAWPLPFSICLSTIPNGRAARGGIATTFGGWPRMLPQRRTCPTWSDATMTCSTSSCRSPL